MEAAANSNLKKVTLELGGKSPNIIYDDANLDQAVAWASHGILYVPLIPLSYLIYRNQYSYSWFTFSWNHGQACTAGSRIFVQEGIYDKFLEKFTEKTKSLKVGDPFTEGVYQGPQVSQIQYDVRSPFSTIFPTLFHITYSVSWVTSNLE